MSNTIFYIFDYFIIATFLYLHLESESFFSHSAHNDFKFSNGNSSTVIILWWTDNLFTHIKSYETIYCKTGSCDTTKLKKFQHDRRTRAFIFYGTDFNGENLPLPREQHHEWALIHEESPMNNYMLSHSLMIKLFNYTSTFRKYSDYSLTSQFIYSLNYLIDRKPVPLSEKNELKQKGLASVLYIQSHCNVASDRDRYVKELMKYIGIDSYGKCLHNKDLPESLQDTLKFADSEFLDFIARYKFHIAFENALCEDYMTEKLFRPLHVGSIPIYRGSSSAKDWMPNNHSGIFVNDFTSPRELAEFIKKIDYNDEEYEKYLEFKSGSLDNLMMKNQVINREWDPSDNVHKVNFLVGFECYVCDQILERLRKEAAYNENSSNHLLIQKIANNSHLGCPQPYVSLGDIGELRPSDPWLEDNWIEDYWYGFDKAKAIRKMIDVGETNSSKFFQYLHNIMLNNES